MSDASGAAVRLEVLEGEGQGQTVHITGISVIGRDAASALVIPSRTVSREHAVVRPEEGFGFVVEDLDSRSGTFVNGVRTRKAVLQDGDLLRIGSSVIKVHAAPDASSGEVPPDEVEVVKTRFMPTTRLTLDAVRFRTRTRDLTDRGPGSSVVDEAPAAAPESPAEPTPSFGVSRAEGAPATRSLPTPDPTDAAAVAAHRLELLCEISTSLAAIHDPARLTRETALRLFGMFPHARRIGFFELEDEAAQQGDPVLRPRYLVDRSTRETGERVRVSQSALEAAVRERKAILSEDVSGDPRLGTSRSLAEAGVYSLLCVPLCLGERVLGALYVDSTDAVHRFDEGALRLATGVAAILAAAFENAHLFARVQAETVRRSNLERYFSPGLAERVLKGEVQMARQGAVSQGTIIFVDIRGFTRLTDTTEPTVLVATLNAYFAAMQRIIFRAGGTVERFGGDSILAYWGVVGDDVEAPLHAARAALAMQIEVFRLNPELAAARRPTIKVAIGVNTGDVISGDVGSPERYEFTVLGDAINLARRLEAQALGWEVIAGPNTVAILAARALHRPLPPTTVKGKEQPVHLSALFGLRTDDAPLGTRRWDLALPAALDLAPPGKAPPAREPVLIAQLEVDHGGRARLEVVTAQDPDPGDPARLTFALPRSTEPLEARGRIRGASADDTVMLGAGLTAGDGLQRVRLDVDDPARLLAALGVPL